MNPTTKQILNVIENALRTGELTPTNKIEGGNFLILTQKLPDGQLSVWRGDYDTMNEVDKTALKGRVKGDTVGGYRVSAIFDRW